MSRKRVLVVGAGGFVGASMVEEGLRRGYEVWAGVRQSTSREYLTDDRIRFVVFDYDDPAAMARALSGAMPGEKWDYIIYNLGATKVRRYADFNRINYEYLRTFTGALHATDMVPDRLLYISSLSVLGPHDTKDYAPMDENLIPQPDTRYGASKLKAELWLATSRIPYVVLRSTGVYGPRDHDYFLMLKSLEKGVDFGVGMRRQLLTFIYVDDLARAAYDAAEKAQKNETYIVSEPRAYSQKEFRRLAMRALKRRFAAVIRVPLWMLKAVCVVAERIGALRGKPATLNSDKYRILRQRNWNCSVKKAADEFGFATEIDLEKGLELSVKWYKEQGWLK